MSEAAAAAANEIVATNFQIAKAIETGPASAAKPSTEALAQLQADPQLAATAAAVTADPTLTGLKITAAANRNGGAAVTIPSKPDDAATATQPTAPHDGITTPAIAPAEAPDKSATATNPAGVDGNNGKAADAAATSPGKHHAEVASPSQLTGLDAGSQTSNTAVQPQIQPPTTAPIAAAQLSATAAANLAVPLNGLAVQIASSAAGGKSRFEIRLDPAELGRIDVRLDVDRHGQVTSHLIVEKPETLAMLRQDAPQLQRALEDAGLKTSDNGLQFSLRDQSSSGNNHGNGSERQPHRLIISDANNAPAVTAGRTYNSVGLSRGIDIRV